MYKSGLDYQIHFFDKKNKHLYTRTINSETDIYSKNNDEIKSVINHYINILQQTPTHYIYNLKVDKKFRSDSIIGIIKKDGLDPFLLSETNEQYPQLKLTYCEPYKNENLINPENRFKVIVKNIKWQTNPIDTSFISRTTTERTKYVDFETNKISRLFYFPTNTKIDSIIKQIHDMKIKYFFAESCSQYYFVQVLSKESLKEITTKLMKYSFIENVSEANNGFIYQKCSLYE